MGWFDRIFGFGKPDNAQTNPEPTGTDDQGNAIPPERVGLNGEYDQSGLAKRVALAFDEDPSLDDISTLWVAQTGGTVVLKGSVPSEDILNKVVSIAGGINGATSVDTDQVTVG
ncbi:BON domain-containing protein [Aerosakkonemataceae cyanobacterium BLCC-F154]|uniref:BON domain-containing protein n=1 Tax=Floridaenema fluviatile BLCC-F154 TaxID=3153640 RepID=A0ABV4YH46_9CYAN